MTKRYRNYINGLWVPKPKETFENRNPARTNDLIGTFPESTVHDVDAAVEAAKKAFQSWRLVPAPRRAEILYSAAELLKKNKERLAQLMTREMGKVLKETRGDVQEAIDMAYYVAGMGRQIGGQTRDSEMPNKMNLTQRHPLGVCGLITPWNFPMAIPSWKSFPALLCGNTIVFKPAEDTPASAIEFMKILEKAGLHKGVMNLVCGGPEAGKALLEHPDVHMISFTGSCEVGKIVAEHCGKHLKRCSLEMGGKNAQIVLEDADLELALEGALWGSFGTTGQRCTATSRVYVHKKLYKEFLKQFLIRAKKIRVGDGLDEKTEMGPLISARQRERVHDFVQMGKVQGAKLELGGHFLTGKKYSDGFFYAPTVFSQVEHGMLIVHEEIFGPVVCIMPIGDLDEGIEKANDIDYGLSSAIYTRDVNRAMKAVRDIRAGITYVNGPTIGAEVHLPFGGVKNTGNGHREAGTQVFDAFSEWKSVYIDFSGKLQKAQIDDFTLE